MFELKLKLDDYHLKAEQAPGVTDTAPKKLSNDLSRI